jgi:hypothetical protein
MLPSSIASVDQVIEVLGIEPGGKRTGADEVTKHDGQLSTFHGAERWRICGHDRGIPAIFRALPLSRGCRSGTELLNARLQASSISDRNSEFLEILLRQGRQDTQINIVIFEDAPDVTQSQCAQPSDNFAHATSPLARTT